ncbi:MAG: amidohydrolase [Lachnospiraceae bacterium]|nr:amidohydrolase [Lachnospiraceae bacterium]
MIDIGTKKIPLIDAHVHLFPRMDGFKYKNVPTRSGKYGVVYWGDAPRQQFDPSYTDSSSPAEVYLKLMELNGVDKAFIPQTPVYGKHYDYVDSILRAHPGRFATVGLAYPCGTKERFLREAKEALDERGYLGLKFEMPDTPFRADLPEYAYIFETLMERNKLIMVDMGWGDGEWDFPYEIIAKAVKTYKDLTWVFPHLGVSRLWDREEHEVRHYERMKRMFDLMNVNEHIWWDMSSVATSACQRFEQYPYPHFPEVMKTVKEEIGFERVMFGTDYPGTTTKVTYAQCIRTVTDFCDFLTEHDKERLFYQAADELWFGANTPDPETK